MKSKYLSNCKQTVKLKPSKESLPKLHTHKKENSHVVISGSYHIAAKASNINHNNQTRGESLYTNAQNLVKVTDNIQSLIIYLTSSKINPQLQYTLISSLTNYLLLLKDHKQPTLKKQSRFSKLSLSMINDKTNQLMLSCSQLKNINTQKYHSKVTLTTSKQLHKECSNLNMPIGLAVVNSNIPASSMIPKQRYKPTYLKNKQSLGFDKKSKKSTLLLSQTLKTQQQQSSITQCKQYTNSSLLDTRKTINNEQHHNRIVNMSSLLRSDKINSLCSDIQKLQVYHSVRIQQCKQLENDLVIGVESRMGNSCEDGGRYDQREKSEEITSVDGNINNKSNNEYDKQIVQPQQDQPQPIVTTHQQTASQVENNPYHQNQQLLSLRTQLKQRQSQITNLWIIINSIQPQIR